jgi:hypothetical protein
MVFAVMFYTVRISHSICTTIMHALVLGSVVEQQEDDPVLQQALYGRK